METQSYTTCRDATLQRIQGSKRLRGMHRRSVPRVTLRRQRATISSAQAVMIGVSTPLCPVGIGRRCSVYALEVDRGPR